MDEWLFSDFPLEFEQEQEGSGMGLKITIKGDFYGIQFRVTRVGAFLA